MRHLTKWPSIFFWKWTYITRVSPISQNGHCFFATYSRIEPLLYGHIQWIHQSLHPDTVSSLFVVLWIEERKLLSDVTNKTTHLYTFDCLFSDKITWINGYADGTGLSQRVSVWIFVRVTILIDIHTRLQRYWSYRRTIFISHWVFFWHGSKTAFTCLYSWTTELYRFVAVL